MARQKTSTARQRESEQLEVAWQKKRSAILDHARQIYGQGFRGHDDVGEPIIDGRPLPRSMRGPELVRALERAQAATGDPVFDDAIRALRAYGLDEGGHKRVYARTWSGGDFGYLQQVKYLIDKKRLSSRSASEHVVCEFGIRGPSFQAAADRIRHKFDAWKNSGYPPELLDWEAGDLGYRIAVSPAEGVDVEALASALPTKGSEQPATTWWRRLFREGAVSIRYLGEK